VVRSFILRHVKGLAGRPGTSSRHEPGWMKAQCAKETGLTVKLWAAWPPPGVSVAEGSASIYHRRINC
jgi:hypothetical protein